MLNHWRAVHQNIFHPFGKLIRIVKRRQVAHGRRIEHHHVSPHPRLEHAAIGQSQTLRGQRGKLADRILQRERLVFTDILSQNAWERAISPRMRVLLPKDPRGRGAGRIIVDRDPWLLQSKRHVGLRHPKHGNIRERIFDKKVEECVHGFFIPELRNL